MSGRGMLTDKIKAKALEMLGHEITTAELRLMPYIHYCAMNNARMDPRRMTDQERVILGRWRERFWIEGGAAAPVQVSKEFYDAMNAILWYGYFGGDEQEADHAPA